VVGAEQGAGGGGQERGRDPLQGREGADGGDDLLVPAVE